jgi:DNA-binding response OmpR family regulator
VLLDLGLPDIDGLDVCRRLHARDAGLAIVMLTARDEELDVVVGLDAGAIDYVTKPFKLAELWPASAQLRQVDVRPATDVTVEDLSIDAAARRAWLAGDELVPAEGVRPPGPPDGRGWPRGDRETLMSEVWDEHWFGSTKTLDFHVAALRRKIDEPDGPSRITTLRGVGYRYET